MMRQAFIVPILLTVALPMRITAQGATACSAEQDRQTSFKLPSGEYNNFIGGGIVVRCPDKKITLRADSAELYGDERRIFFVGHVHYNEPRLDLFSDNLTYFQTDERVIASGNVDARLPTGSTLRGPQADYRRAVPRVRPRAQTLATGRPTVTPTPCSWTATASSTEAAWWRSHAQRPSPGATRRSSIPGRRRCSSVASRWYKEREVVPSSSSASASISSRASESSNA